MEPKPQGRRVSAVVLSYYPDLAFGYLVANGKRIGFKASALKGFINDPRVGDLVAANVDDDIAVSVTSLPSGSSPPR